MVGHKKASWLVHNTVFCHLVSWFIRDEEHIINRSSVEIILGKFVNQFVDWLASDSVDLFDIGQNNQIKVIGQLVTLPASKAIAKMVCFQSDFRLY